MKLPEIYDEDGEIVVASFAEAWIEILTKISVLLCPAQVASFAEAWIEIAKAVADEAKATVASFAEAWIEILAIVSFDFFFTSPPSRRRGLK